MTIINLIKKYQTFSFRLINQCFPWQYTYGICQPYMYKHRLFFDVGKKEAKSIDVSTGHAQTTPSCYALNHSWEEHC